MAYKLKFLQCWISNYQQKECKMPLLILKFTAMNFLCWHQCRAQSVHLQCSVEVYNLR